MKKGNKVLEGINNFARKMASMIYFRALRDGFVSTVPFGTGWSDDFDQQYYHCTRYWLDCWIRFGRYFDNVAGTRK